MGRHLVEEDQRREAAHGAHEAGMGQDETDQECLLLAGGGRGRRHVLGAVTHDEVGGWRADEGAAGRTVAMAPLHQRPPETVLGLQGGPDRDEVVEIALKTDRRPGEGRGIVPGLGDEPVQALRGLAAGERHGDAEFGHLALDRVEPAGVVRALVEQAVARAQGRSIAETRAPWLASTARTSRSRKRRRSPAGPRNSPSRSGVSQTIRRIPRRRPAWEPPPSMRQTRVPRAS